jgi:hypothetical protein
VSAGEREFRCRCGGGRLAARGQKVGRVASDGGEEEEKSLRQARARGS